MDLYWLPLGAGGRFVGLNGRLHEHAVARRERRPSLALYHTALEVRLPAHWFTIEMSWPVPADDGLARGVVGN